MTSNNRDSWTSFILAVFVAVACIAVVRMIADLPRWGDKAVEWVGALGTIGAFAGTIWIATSDGRRRRQEAIDLAILTCLSISHDLEWLLENLAVIDSLATGQDVFNTPQWHSFADQLCLRSAWPDHQLAALVCIGGRAAQQMALGKSFISTGSNSLKTFASLMGVTNEGKHKARAVGSLSDARRNLADAAKTMLEFVAINTRNRQR